MQILTTRGWNDYSLLDSGDGKRLEKWGKYTLVRPDPEAIWKPWLDTDTWKTADAVFEKGAQEKTWKKDSAMPNEWLITYQNLSLFARLTPFKHTGIFPEQSIQWEWIKQKLEGVKSQPHVLNLFAYTGIASLIAASHNARVTHVDGSFPSIGWARKNQEVSGLLDKPIRYILDDVLKFTKREIKRGILYDGIIMDPPVYGHGPKGEKWDFSEHFPLLLSLCKQLLTNTPLFLMVNAYALSSSSLMLKNVLKDTLGTSFGTIEHGELALEDTSGRLLSTGIFGRWSAT